MKKTLAWLLTLFMVLTISSVTVFAAGTDVAKIGDVGYSSFEAALNAVKDGETITLVAGATEDEHSKEIDFVKDIEFTITGKAPDYAMPVITFQNATVNIVDAEFMTAELDARQNATINVLNSNIKDVGGNSIVKSYYNGAINIAGTSEVYTMQVTTMGYITVSDTAKLNATWQTNVYGNGLITVEDTAVLATGALNLTGKDYEGRDNTDTDRVGKPATVVVDGATLKVGEVYSSSGADYSYNADSYGINVGTISGKAALFDIKNGANVSLRMQNNGTVNFGADATVNVADSALKVICRGEGEVALNNNGLIKVQGDSTLNIPVLSGTAVYVTDDTTLTDTVVGGAVYAGYGANKTDSLELAIAGNFQAKGLYVGNKYEHYTNGEVHTLTIKDGAVVNVGALYVRPTCVATVTNATVNAGDLFVRGSLTVDGSTMSHKSAIGGGTGHWTVYEDDDATKTATLTLNNSAVSTNYLVVGSNSNSETDADSNATLTVNGGSLTLSSCLYVQGSDTFKNNSVSFTDTTVTAKKAYLHKKAATNVYGQCTITIDAVTGGNTVDCQNGATLKDSTVGGGVYVLGNVTFAGDNTFAMLYDFGAAYSNPGAHWTVASGATVTLTDTARYGLGYGDKVTIQGALTNALTARVNLTNDDLSFFAHGIALMDNWDEKNYLTVKDAYVVLGSNNSFGTKSDYGAKGDFYLEFTNSVLDTSRITIDAAGGTTYFTFTDSDIKAGGWSSKQADSTATFTNSVMLVTGNGTDWNNENAGQMTLVKSAIVFQSGAFTNNGTLTLDATSSLTAPSITGTGKIVIDATNYVADTQIINADMSGFTGTVEVTGNDDVYAAIENGQLVLKSYVAKIGDVKYPTLQAAIDAAVAGDTIVVLKDVTVTTPAHGQNALNYAKAVDCVIDLNGKTLTADTGNSVFRFNISGSTATSNVTVTLKNGKVVAGPNTWCAVMATGLSADAKAIFNLENLTIENSKPGDLAVKAWSNSVINATNVVVNSTKGAGCFYAVGGEMVLTNCTATQEGLHTAPYLSMAFAVSDNGKLTVNSGNYSSTPTAAAEGNNQGTSHGSWVGGVMNSGGTLIINDGTFANGNFDDDSLATAARGLLFVDTYASLEVNGGTFNALKSIIDYQNNLGIAAGNPVVTLKGGTYSADPSHATYKFIADDHRVNANTDGTFTVAIIPYVAQVGSVKYESLADAIAAAVDGDTVLLIDDITTDSAVAISEKITLDLNGKTITGVDNATGSFGLININPGAELTITGNGKITLTAANNRAWNAYSSVISNQRGKLIVENGTIEHLGGTDMAYGIDNLTNGKGTYAETVINGGTIKSTYRAIRQFLNGVEAQNILTINAGTVYGANTGVFFHDPSANANSGTLTIAEGAQVNGVYLFVTAGSTEWPVEVSIAGSAIGAQGVTSKNVPDGYALDFVEGNYGVYNGVARIGTTCYETLEAAIAAAVDGDTIELLMGVEITKTLDVSYNSDFDKIDVVINGNGHTVKAVASDYWTANPKAWLADIAWNVTLNDIVFDGNNLGMRGLQFYTSESVLNNVTVKNISNDSWGITDYAIHSNASELTVTGALTFENCKHGHLAVSVGSNLPADTVSNVTVADSAVVSGVTVVLGGDNTTVVTKNPAMVSGAVTNLNNVYYSTLEDAFAAAANNSTITLIADVNAAVTYAVNKTLTLDLSGYTIESDAAATLTATAGKLTIVDSSADKSGAIIGAKAIHSSAYVAIQSGKFVGAITTANNQADDSQVCITGGNFSVEPNANIIKHTYIAVLAEDGTYNVIPDEYEVIIIANGGEVSGAGFYKFGETVYLFAGNYPGYQFAGWMSDDVELTDRGNTLISFAMPDHAVTVTAYWATSGVSTPVVPVVTGTLHFETNGGTAIDSLTGVSGRRVDLTQYVPALEGYTFAGWYSDAALTKPVAEITLRGTKTVYAGWIKNVTPDVPVVTMPFTDVAADAYYYNAVLWAVNTGITNGITDTTFAPDMVCTRAQVVTFLWRAAGCPVATYNDMPFVDVSRDMYYYDAVLWAVEMGITNGISDTEFAPDAECSRAQIVTFLWRALGAPDAAADAGFVDVDADAYYATAVEWAVDNGITNGMGDNTFGADADCTRGQTVTFLFRFFCK